MTSLDAMLALLVRILRESSTGKATVTQFQSLVWECPRHSIAKDTYDVLADLAYDLDYFEPDPVSRAQDASYYGHERLEQEIQAALRRLSELGVEVPTD
jgi:hypothetical protein